MHSPSRVVQLSVQHLRARCPRDISVFLLHRIRDFARPRSSPCQWACANLFQWRRAPGCCAARPVVPRV